MRIINNTLESPLNYTTVTVSNYNGTVRMTIDGFVYVDDDVKYIYNFASNITELTGDSILLGGLNLGILPYYIDQNKTFSKFDVIEKNADIISAVNTLGHLSGNVNIIQDNFLTYTPTQTYDLIISDLHWGSYDYEPNWEGEIDSIKVKYREYLNTNGALYIPLIKYVDYNLNLSPT